MLCIFSHLYVNFLLELESADAVLLFWQVCEQVELPALTAAGEVIHLSAKSPPSKTGFQNQ